MRIKNFLSLLALVVTFSLSFLPAQNAFAAKVEATHAVSVETGKININSADAHTLASSIKGIGLKKAQAIVDFRESNGPFVNIQDLVSVKGIGEKTVAKNASLLTVK
ncbi:ComEA family DNA-binding protein [Alkalimarinus alittae]|uniref:ComEA family DNA-binding protein n=1 Tax=Alkalimarinus alittae TaxID=2961619 RepID=UPI0029FED8C2|nr:ComEA family DNA-binding protein [Alkalimarinus alittae]